MTECGAIARTAEQKQSLEKFQALIAKYRQLVAPVADKLLANGCAYAQLARAAMKAADAVFDKTNGLVRTVFMALLPGFAAFVVVSVVLVQRLARSIVDPMNHAHDFAKRIAAGDLRQAPTVQGKAEASAMEELTGTVQHSADSAQVAHRGGDVVSRVVGTMDEISGASRRINDIIGAIDGIAFQTSILALNAAVEADLVEQSAAAAQSLREQAQRLGEMVSRFRLD
jgi:methyl-accepting chemotaxis protein